MRALRSLLFVPGDSARKFEKARTSGADALILDLEDSVAPNTKAAARKSVQAMLEQRAPGQTIFVRVNGLTTGLVLEDLKAVVGRCDGVMLPKCSGAADLTRLSFYLDAFESAFGAEAGATRILPIVTETAESLFGLAQYPRDEASRLAGLVWGAEDLAADIGASRKRGPNGHSSLFMMARNSCLLAAARAGVSAIDTVYTSIPDLEGLLHEAKEARADGFQAKLAIHPAQIETINQAFSVAPEERAWAEEVVAAFAREPGKGALRVGDQMVDVPHLRLAEKILARQ
jgi:citrate lyase subunit beta / citryl-CoA lyase